MTAPTVIRRARSPQGEALPDGSLRLRKDGDEDAPELEAMSFAALTKLLNAETEQLNQTFAELEAEFASAGVNAPARVLLETDDDTELGIRYETWLCYGKFDGKWCLYIHETDDTTGDSTSVLITKASRDTRIMAADKVPELRMAIRDEVIKEIKRVRVAQELNRRQCDELRRGS